MNEDDEAFEQLALKQGQWEHMRIEPLGDGKYKLSYPGRNPDPANPYTVWWPCLRQEPNGCNWEYRLTKEEVMERLEKNT